MALICWHVANWNVFYRISFSSTFFFLLHIHLLHIIVIILLFLALNGKFFAFSLPLLYFVGMTDLLSPWLIYTFSNMSIKWSYFLLCNDRTQRCKYCWSGLILFRFYCSNKWNKQFIISIWQVVRWLSSKLIPQLSVGAILINSLIKCLYDRKRKVAYREKS